MKIAFYPNICNNNYPIVTYLRNESDIDAHLYIPEDADIQNLPESENPDLINNYPSWIHKDKRWKPSDFLIKRNKDFINELNRYDVVVLSDFGVALAPYIKAYKIFSVTGGDLTIFPFQSKFSFKNLNIFTMAKSFILSTFQSRGIQKIDEFWTQPFAPFLDALKALRISENKIKPAFYRVFIDIKKIKNNENAINEIDTDLKEQLDNFNFKIFHPSRFMISKTKTLVQSGQWKNNDLLIRAFAKFLKEYKVKDACLILLNRKTGGEVGLAKEIISELGIEKNIVWLNPEFSQGYPKNELLNFYSVSDVVADEFGIGWFGSVVCEGMACQKPTFCYVDQNAMNKMYNSNPIISTNNLDEITIELYKLYSDKAYYNKKAKDSYDWIIANHTQEGYGKELLSKFLSLKHIIKVSKVY